MIWLMWRQHRAEAVALGLFLAALGTILVIGALPMHASFRNDGVADCLARGTPFSDTCVEVMARFGGEYGGRGALLPLLGIIPFAIGGFLGSSLLARELEAGTWQLAWTQAVPRMRWLAVKLVTLVGVTIALAGALAAVTTWYRGPLDAIGGRFESTFDIEGVAPPAYAAFAFATAAASGLLLRRSLPALAAAFVAFLAVRAGVSIWARPNYQRPVTTNQDVSNPHDWLLDTGLVDGSGHHLTFAEENAMANAARNANMDLTGYLDSHGVARWDTYQPGDRFWTFQLIESAIFVAVAAALIVMVAWRVRRRAL